MYSCFEKKKTTVFGGDGNFMCFIALILRRAFREWAAGGINSGSQPARGYSPQPIYETRPYQGSQQPQYNNDRTGGNSQSNFNDGSYGSPDFNTRINNDPYDR